MLKKVILIASLVSTALFFSGCGLGKDKVTDTNYKISLQDAAKIYQKNTNSQQVNSINFDIAKSQHDYSYIFDNGKEQVIVNPQTGKVTKIASDNQNTKNTPYDISKVNRVAKVNDILKKAKDKVGGLSPRILTWTLIQQNGKLIYSVSVKTTTSDKLVEIDAN